jgi:hypothetical protein
VGSLNPPSYRYPFALAGQPEEVQQAHTFAFNAILDLQEANKFNAAEITALKAASSSTSTTTVTNTTTTVVTDSFPGLGRVNDQTGQTVYVTTGPDSGILLIINDASPVAVTPNPAATSPYFFFITNFGAGIATLTPASPALINGGASFSLPQSYWALVVFDGTNWSATSVFSPLGGDLSGNLPNATVVGIQTVPVAVTAPTNAQVFEYNSSSGKWTPTTNGRIFGATIGSGDVGKPQYITVPFNCTITSWTIIADTSGTATCDVWFLAGSAPPSAPSIPLVGNKISASAPIATSSAQSAAGGSTAISTWTKALTQWGTLAFNLSSMTTSTKVTIQIQVSRS